MAGRYLSLYYGSLDARRALIFVGALLGRAFRCPIDREMALAGAVQAHLGPAEVYAYSTARGALAAVLRAANIGPGDEVLLSAFTCLAVPTAVVAVGARPVYVDIDAKSLNVPGSAMLAAIGPNVRAIIIQHTMGSVADVDQIVAVARARGILTIEDCALAVGTRRNGRPVGTTADAALFSMEMSKTISSGWGGILALRKAELCSNVEQGRRQSVPANRWHSALRAAQIAISAFCYQRQVFPLGRYVVAAAFRLGLFRPSTAETEEFGVVGPHFVACMGAAQVELATAQWRRLEAVSQASSESIKALRDALETNGFEALGSGLAHDEPVSPRIAFLADDRRHLIDWFRARNVEVGTWFDGPLTPLPKSPIFAYQVSDFPVAAKIAERIVNLPTHVGITRDDRDRVIRLIDEYAVTVKQEFSKSLA